MTKIVFDRTTVEVLEEPEFVKVYIKELCGVKGMNASQVKIFNFMLANMNWDNVVSYGSKTKNKFIQENGLKNQTFNNNVSALIRSSLIERIGRGEFVVNPKYVVKVDWSKVQLIRWSSEYSRDGKKEVVEVIGNSV